MTELIVALDLPTLSEASELVERLKGTVRFFKVGLQLFSACGPRAVEAVRRSGAEVFLDLKLHDIPQTVSHAVREAGRLGVHSVSLHLSGGPAMIEAAVKTESRPRLWGVTVLTSHSPADLRAVHPALSVAPLARRLAALGVSKGIDAVICSGREVPALRRALGPEAVFVCPGIRPPGGPAHDQRRLVTPAEAERLGIRYAVVGRPVTKAPDPLAAAQEMLSQMRNARPGGRR